ncbi:TPA: hypothetical protein CPT85_04535 [Candidatus Gastranaerophilales bacterium HUM_21]|jgi:hypothetical protein|nr:MAG TPA: hypothetical protein CPT85_04535 [Candidatus Gastranaerophilales bacterium HUM_21]
MSVYDNLISILFKLPDGRSLNEYYKNVLLVGKITEDDLQTDVEFPSGGVGKYSSYDEVIAVFKPTSQFAIEANAVFNQKSNSQTTSQIQYLMIAKQDDSGALADALNRAKASDGRFAKVVPVSRVAADLKAVADWCLTNKRFCDLPVTDVDDVAEIVAGGNDYAYGVFSKSATNPIASAVASTSTCGYFGGKDGSAQFTQLTGILPEVYTGEEISEMNTNNVAYYTNVSPIDGGQTEGFGYNWIIGSRMLGGELRQRQMIKDYIEKDMGLMALEFFNQKPVYDETGNNLLLTMAQKRFRSYQTYNLVIETNNEQTGFELKVIPIRTGADSIMNTDVEAYNAKKFKLQGYYYDAIVGEKVDFLFYVDPSDEQVEQILGEDE